MLNMMQKLCWLLLLFVTKIGFAQNNPFHNEWIDFGKTYYKLKVMGFGSDSVGAPLQKGIVRIPYTTLSSAGLAGVAAEEFQLWRDGEEVPIYVSKPSGQLSSTDYIEFVGQINKGKLDQELYRNPDFQLNDRWSLQTDTASYFLTSNAGPNKRLIDVINNPAASSLPADTYFMHTVGRYYRSAISNGFSASLGKSLYSSSYDKGEGYVSRAVRPVAGCGSATLPQNFYNLHPYLQGPDITLRVNSVGDAQNSRTVKLNLNGDSITTFQMDYVNYAKIEETAPVSKLSSGNALFQVVNLSRNGCDEMRVGIIELSYPRQFDLGNASSFSLTLSPGTDGRLLKIFNFKTGGVAPVLYDIANGKRYIGDISNADTTQFLLEPSDSGYELFLSSQAGQYYKEITTMQQRRFTNFSSAANQGNYLIISNPLIYGPGSTNYVEQYAQYRASAAGGSFTTKVVDVNELVDQFAWGVKKHPLSIKNFLRYARATFTEQPKYVFLIGKGVVYNEYRANESNPLADQLNLVPTWGNPASDNLLASDDLNAIPATPIGRLSAISASEVGDYLLKVKQHDSAQRSPIQTIEAKGWMKNVIQIAGANDIGLGNQLDNYLENYKSIIADTTYGANVIDFSKTADPAGYPDAIQSFKKIYENGASLITYFGHSSATSLDFNLDDPQTYNNRYKYPVFVANGCSAGNHFLFEPNRLKTKSTISEKFVLSPERGAVGYLASTHYGVINYLDLYTRNFYKALSNTNYNASVGSVIKEAIQLSLDSTGKNDYYSRVHAEQYAFHGDPALVINASTLPDYVVERPQMVVTPNFVSVADTSFSVKIRVNNIGRATGDPVTLRVLRETPGGEIFTLDTKTFASVNLADSITVIVPVVANRDAGVNKITATVDYTSANVEVSETNNEATIEVLVSEDEIRPVFPYNLSIVNNSDQVLYASTVNPLNALRNYRLEVDTTALFNSLSKVSQVVASKGGIVEFNPQIAYTNETTYYWRVAPDSNALHWNNASFVFRNHVGEGFEQGHVLQHTASTFKNISLDSTTGKFSFTPQLHNLFITNSIYPTSGTEDEHFSISVDGTSSITSACLGRSIIFNVFDPITFKPWINTTQPFGAAATCAPGREYNFEYSYTTAASRKNAMNFLDAVPAGNYVVARLILDDPYNTTAGIWASDTLVYGKNNSLYSRLKSAGFSGIDSFSYPRTWAFVYKKGDSTFTPSFAFSQGMYDKMNLSVNCHTTNTSGTVSSPAFGPAKKWKTVEWQGAQNAAGTDSTLVRVIAIDKNNHDSVFATLPQGQHQFDISALDALQYPKLKLELQTTDTLSVQPFQLKEWTATYDAVPEGALAPNLHFNLVDTFGTYRSIGGIGPDTLHFSVAFKNVSKAAFDSIPVKVLLIDADNIANEYVNTKIRPIAAGDTVHIDLDVNVNGLSGWYNLLLQVNANGDYTEQYGFNNFLYKYVYFDAGSTLATNTLNFSADLQNGVVRTTWWLQNEENIQVYELQRLYNNAFNRIATVAVGSAKTYVQYDKDAIPGYNYYRIKMVHTDGSISYSPVVKVWVKDFAEIMVYPNPVKELLQIKAPVPLTGDLILLNAFGQRVITSKFTGSTTLNLKGLPSGTYVLQLNQNGKKIIRKIQKQ